MRSGYGSTEERKERGKSQRRRRERDRDHEVVRRYNAGDHDAAEEE